MRTLFLLAVPAALCAALVATHVPQGRPIFVVDDDGTADFHDIPDALAAVPDGALVLVRSGFYSGATVRRAVTLVGEPVLPNVSGTFAIEADAARVRIVSLRLDRLSVRDSHDVLLDSVEAVQASVDASRVRMTQSYVAPHFDGGATALEIHASRVELVGCSVYGDRGYRAHVCGYDGGDGGDGIVIGGASRVELSGSCVSGGYGGGPYGFLCSTGYGGDGGDAVVLTQGTTAVVRGIPSNFIAGGLGYDPTYGFEEDGYAAVLRQGSSLRHSGVTFDGRSPVILVVSGSTHEPLPDDPSLARTAPLEEGGQLAVRVHAHPGSSVRLRLRYDAAGELVPIPETVDLGLVGISGSIDHAFPLPPNVGPGVVLTLRARVTLPLGEVRTTNELVSIVR